MKRKINEDTLKTMSRHKEEKEEHALEYEDSESEKDEAKRGHSHSALEYIS